jgi:alpha 1,3-glucosidase
MPKDNNHADGREHREVHNIYGMLQQRATAEGLVKRNKGDRPFVLSRAFFIGTQRYGAIWTGDNTATWSHLEASVPMLLSLNIAGIMFSGADVGGFFGNPDPELLTRWYQLAVYQPFFRGHAHIETKRREPYLLSEPFSSAVRNAIRERGQLLPYLYTTFYQAHVTGSPIMRPFFFEFPGYEESGSVGYLLGKSMAVFPVTLAGQSIIKIKLPESVSWFSWSFCSIRYDSASLFKS